MATLSPWRLVRWLAAIAVLLLLTACNGGGGGGGGSSSSSSSGDGFTVSATSLSFNATQNTALPPAQDIQTSFTNPEAYYVGAAYPPGVSPVSWLTITQSGSGNSYTFHFSVNTTGLSPGTYSTTIGLGIARKDGSIITYRNVDISYTVAANLTASPAALNFAYVTGNPAPTTQVVNVGGTGLTWSASANQSWVKLTGNSGTASGAFTVGVDTNLSPGIYNATIQIVSGGTTLGIPVSYTVRAPNILTSSNQITLSLTNGTPSPPMFVNVLSENGVTIPYTTSIVYGAGASGWLSTSTNSSAPGSLPIGFDTFNTPPGSYTADLILIPQNGAPPVTVHVSYTVIPSALTLNPSQATFSINASSTTAAADIKRTIIVSQTGSILSWTASSSVPWLAVSPGSGTNYETVTLALVPAQLDALENGQHTATVTFTYSGPFVSNKIVSLPVTLDMNMPYVNYVSPYVAYTNTSRQVIIRGSGFSSISGQQLQFGSNAVSNFTVVNDTEIRVTHPVLAAGSYPVRVANGLGIDRTRARLLVKAPPTFAYAVLPTSLVRDRTLFDAERVAVYTNNMAVYFGPPGVPRIERHRLVSGSWVTDSLLLNGYPRDIAITPDGREMIALSSSTLYHINLDSWAIIYQFDLATFGYPYNYSDFSRIAMSNDGNALVHVGSQWINQFRYNVLTRTFAPVPIIGNNNLYGGIAPISSMDGSRILVGQNGVSGPLPLYYLDTSTSQFVQAHPNLTVGRMSYDRTGSYSLIDGTVFNQQFQPQGIEYNLMIGTISPDGTRAYGFVYGSNVQTLHAYDLTRPTGSGGFTEIGTGIQLPTSPGDFANVAISADGSALFVSGESNFIIHPVP